MGPKANVHYCPAGGRVPHASTCGPTTPYTINSRAHVLVHLVANCDGGESPHFPTEDGTQGRITALTPGTPHAFFVLLADRSAPSSRGCPRLRSHGLNSCRIKRKEAAP